MKLLKKLGWFLLLYPLTLYSYTDERHYSTTFETIRYFRVFTPLDYDTQNNLKRYPVIYYFHGCGGSYQRSGTYRYRDYGLTPPVARDRAADQAYEFSNNADFENLATSHQVIIICVDGRIEELPEGCKVYFPSQAKNWQDNYYNFSLYIRELIEVVDDRYRTKTGAAFRAVTGLSMGGHMAIWIAATNPHLFSSASQFCYSPDFYAVGEPAYQTTVDLKELWRNLRGLPFRHATTDRDYLRYYTEELFSIYAGAGFENEYYLADYCHHAAARMDLQMDFHVKHFGASQPGFPCFSHLNLYPDFEIWGYQIKSSKSGNGWIYLNNVTANGLGLYTRQRLPWGNDLSEFEITVHTPAVYEPLGKYQIVRYAYRTQTFSQEEVTADTAGKLIITTSGGSGEEIGILGKGLPPPVMILTDTSNENIYLKSNTRTYLPFEAVNLSGMPQTVEFHLSTEDTALLNITSQPQPVTIPAQSKLRIDSLVQVQTKDPSPRDHTAYLTISSTIGGVLQERKQIIQVRIIDHGLPSEATSVKIFDGRSETLTQFKYQWNGWNQPVSPGVIEEGEGDGNGHPEIGETFSIWIAAPDTMDTKTVMTWHPITPIQTGRLEDFTVQEIIYHSMSTGRGVPSAQLQLSRIPTNDHPVRIPFQSEWLRVSPLQNDCHRNAADDFKYVYGTIVLKGDGKMTIEME